MLAACLLNACASGPASNAKDDSPESAYLSQFEDLSLDELILAGDHAFRQGQIKRALMFYFQVVQLDGRADVWFKIGKAEARLGNHEEAARAYAAVLQHDPGHAGAHQEVGLYYLSARHAEAARRELETAVTLDPSLWRSHNGLGFLADIRKDHSAAVLHYQAALEINPNSAALLNNLGYSYYLAGDLDRASRHFESALQLNSRYQNALANLGLLRARQGRYRDAIRILEKTSQRPQAFNDVGYIALVQGDLDTADWLFSEALRLSPTYYQTAAENRERVAEAREEFETGGRSSGFVARAGASNVPAIDQRAYPALSIPLETDEADYRRVDIDVLNVRSTGDAAAPIVGVLKVGSRVEVVTEENGWALVSYEDSGDVATDQVGNRFAVESAVDSLWVQPARFGQQPDGISALAAALGMNNEMLAGKLAENDQYSWNLLCYIEPASTPGIDKLQIPGVRTLRESTDDLPDKVTTCSGLASKQSATGWVLARFLESA